MPRPLSSFGRLAVHAFRLDDATWQAFDGLRVRKGLTWPEYIRWILSVVEAQP